MINKNSVTKSENWFEKHRLVSIVGAFIIFFAVISAAQRIGSNPDTKLLPTDNSETNPVSAPATPEPAKPINLSGTGQAATDKFELKTGLATAKLTHQSEGHFSVWLLDNNGEKIELLANDSGRQFSGSKAFRVPVDGQYLLDISADGLWSVDISQ